MAVDYFLKIDGIPGESSDTVHAGEIDVQSWDFGVEMPHDSHGATADPRMREFTVTVPSSKATPLLMQACYENRDLGDVVLACRKAGTKPQEYMAITLRDAHLVEFDISAADAGTGERLTFTYARLALFYRPQKADGSLDARISVEVTAGRE